MALTDVDVSIRCARLLICNQSDKVMCGDTLSLTLWTKSIDCLYLFADLSLIFLCPHPHFTLQHILSLYLLFYFSVFSSGLLNIESLYICYFFCNYNNICKSISLLIYSGQTFSSTSSHVNRLSIV